ncbi:MAG: hypothetical protein FWF63_09780 [Fibromonadales bacterium]|jgi:hypothetical protein|nr:hypothetical protein [Fibromonadales bacterium]
MDFFNLIGKFNNIIAKGNRPTIVQSLLHIIGLFLFALILLVFIDAYFQRDSFFPYIFLFFILILVVVFIVVYRYFMLNNPELLKTEQYQLEKMAIENRLIGEKGQKFIKEEDLNDIPKIKSEMEVK